MTSLLERIVAIIAPHRCIVCSNYNNVVCESCVFDLPRIEYPLCILCGAPTADWRMCACCQPITMLDGVWVASEYAGVVADLVKRYKFTHARAAHAPLAQHAAAALPFLGQEWLVVAIPTTSVHIRQRGYDHARLLAQEVARVKGLRYVSALSRLKESQQRGATRQMRHAQMKGVFAVHKNVEGKKVLLVDDVCTTGATLGAAAAALKKAGAVEVWGGVVAWKK